MHQLIRYGISAALVLVYILHLNGVLRIGVLEQAENSSYDARIRTFMPNTIDPQVVIIDIDERSTEIEGQFPWRRAKIGRLVENLFDEYGVRTMGFDITFPEPERNALREVAEDLSFLDERENSALVRDALIETVRGTEMGRTGEERFADALRGRSVALGFVFQLGETRRLGALPEPLLTAEQAAGIPAEFIEAPGFTANVEALQRAAKAGGFFDNPTLPDEADGVYRRVPAMQKYEGAIYPSLALEVARLSLGEPSIQFAYDNEVSAEQRGNNSLAYIKLGEKKIPVDERISIHVPYRGEQGSFRYVSATDVLSKTADASVLKDAVVLLGTSAPGLLDLRSTPVSGAFIGVEVHANIVSGILNNSIKFKPGWMIGAEAVLMTVIGALMAWLFPRAAPSVSALVILSLVALITGISVFMWTQANMIVPLGAPVLGTMAMFLMHLLYGYFVESRGKREVTRMFGQYVPPELVDELAERPEALNLEGESREMSVLFSDVRGFTTISEGLDSKELTELMNEFLTPLTRVIHEHRGTIDKYMGDAIMAFWGAPLDDPEHARNALEAGLEMTKAVRRLDDAFEKRGWPKLYIGVGVNTGVMSVGNMGSEFRMAYTVMGDAVNLGSRLEGQTKAYGVEFIVSEATKLQVPEFAYRELDRIRVKGKKEPVTIFEPIAPKAEISSSDKQLLSRHRQALRMYRDQQWDAAEAEFFGIDQSSAHPVNALYLQRIAHFRANPPGPDWDGVFTATSK